jgi:hypothetical protein
MKLSAAGSFFASVCCKADLSGTAGWSWAWKFTRHSQNATRTASDGMVLQDMKVAKFSWLFGSKVKNISLTNNCCVKRNFTNITFSSCCC